MEAVFHNPAICDRLVARAKIAREENPVLELPADDMRFALNCVLNVISDHFSLGVIGQDLSRAVSTTRYIFCITCEPVGERRYQKIRALLVQHDLLLAFPYHESMPKLESAWHEERVKTLRHMAAAYATDPAPFATMEISA